MNEPNAPDPLAAFTAEAASAPDPRIGAILQDRYRIVRRLGAGGMGVVYEGEHLLIKRRVAIKCLHPQVAEDADALGRFLQEARAASSIGNEHIIDVMDLGKFPDGSAFMVLEFLDGRSLSSELQQCGPLTLGRTVHIASQICEALGAAHAKGVVHRDLKPDNIFLLKHGSNPDFVKVLDFGISKILGDAAGDVKTRTGLIMGTLNVMPPEQLRAARDMDHRVDIYALGVIIFRALTGQFPFKAATVPMLAMKIASWPVPSVRAFRPDLPPAFERLLTAVLSKSMHERPRDCRALQQALAPFASVFDPPRLLAPPVDDENTEASINPQVTPFATIDDRARPAPLQPPAAAQGPGARRIGWLVASCVCALAMVGTAAAVGLRTRDAPSARPSPPVVTRVATPALVAAAPPPVASPPHVVVPTPAPALPSALPAAAPTAVPPAVVNVRVQIQTHPESAELFLDGGRISNPFDGELPRSASPRRLEVRLAGYATVVQDLMLNVPQTVRVRLRRGHGIDDHRAPLAPINSWNSHPTTFQTPSQSPSVVTPPAPQGIISNPF